MEQNVNGKSRKIYMAISNHLLGFYLILLFFKCVVVFIDKVSSRICCTQPYLKISLTYKRQDIQGENPNHPPHIVAHLQGKQNPSHKANLAKELQMQTQGKQLPEQ